MRSEEAILNFLNLLSLPPESIMLTFEVDGDLKEGDELACVLFQKCRVGDTIVAAFIVLVGIGTRKEGEPRWSFSCRDRVIEKTYSCHVASPIGKEILKEDLSQIESSYEKITQVITLRKE